MRWLLLVAAVYAALLLGLCTVLQPSYAHHNGPWLPDDPARFPVQSRIMARGYVTYCFDQTATAYPNFRAQAREVADYATSVHGLPAYEVPFGVDCDVQNMMPSDASFTSLCGTGAAACIEYWRDPVRIYYRRALGYGDWRSALCHEGASNTGHMLWMHEHYNDLTFTSNGNRNTCMDFGTFVWQITAYDRDRIWNAFVPDRPRNVSLIAHGNGWATVKWDSVRFDNGAAHLHNIASNTNATRVSFGWSPTPEASTVRWAGEFCGPEYGYCDSAFRDGQRGFDSFWYGCLWLRVENNAFWFVPQKSAPFYWTLAGCFGTPVADHVNAVLQQWWPDKVGDATCITWRESGWNELAESPPNFNGTVDRGLFQINSVHATSGFLASLGRTWADMLNSWHNAAVARILYNHTNSFQPWFTRGLCGV